MNLAEQLTEIYEKHETWHSNKLSHEDAIKYHQTILDSGNCITVSDGEILVGYCEYYLSHGVCYIQNLFIRKEYRLGKAILLMKRRLFQVCDGAKIFIGDRNKFNKRYTELSIRSNHGK